MKRILINTGEYSGEQFWIDCLCFNNYAVTVHRARVSLQGLSTYDNGLDFLLGLFGNRDHTIQILVHKESHKHLKREGPS